MIVLENIVWILLNIAVIFILLLLIGLIVGVAILGLRALLTELRGNNETDNL